VGIKRREKHVADKEIMVGRLKLGQHQSPTLSAHMKKKSMSITQQNDNETEDPD
jgi:hypothetical protein